MVWCGRIVCGMAAVFFLVSGAIGGDEAANTGDGRAKDGLTPLHLAAQKGDVAAVKDLLAKGATVDAAAEDGKTPLHLAAKAGNKEVMALLLDKGADATAKDAYGNTPLILAAEHASCEACRLLIDHKADVKAQALNKYTPLHKAAWGGNPEVAKLLIAKGADFNAEDYDMRVPMHYASTKSVVEVLVAAGADAEPALAALDPHAALGRGDARLHRGGGGPDRAQAGISWPPIPATSRRCTGRPGAGTRRRSSCCWIKALTVLRGRLRLYGDSLGRVLGPPGCRQGPEGKNGLHAQAQEGGKGQRQRRMRQQPNVE